MLIYFYKFDKFYIYDINNDTKIKSSENEFHDFAHALISELVEGSWFHTSISASYLLIYTLG